MVDEHDLDAMRQLDQETKEAHSRATIAALEQRVREAERRAEQAEVQTNQHKIEIVQINNTLVVEASARKAAEREAAALREENERLKAESDLRFKRMSFEADQHAKKCVMLADMQAERDALKHDIARHIAIASEQATEIEGLRAERDALRLRVAELEGALQDGANKLDAVVASMRQAFPDSVETVGILAQWAAETRQALSAQGPSPVSALPQSRYDDYAEGFADGQGICEAAVRGKPSEVSALIEAGRLLAKAVQVGIPGGPPDPAVVVYFTKRGEATKFCDACAAIIAKEKGDG